MAAIQVLVHTEFQALSVPHALFHSLEGCSDNTRWVELLAGLDLSLSPVDTAVLLWSGGTALHSVQHGLRTPWLLFPTSLTSLSRPAGCVLCA